MEEPVERVGAQGGLGGWQHCRHGEKPGPPIDTAGLDGCVSAWELGWEVGQSERQRNAMREREPEDTPSTPT